MAYSLSNKYAKKFCKRTVLVQVIIKMVVTCFWNTVSWRYTQRFQIWYACVVSGGVAWPGLWRRGSDGDWLYSS